MSSTASDDKRILIKKRLSDGTWYHTRLDSLTHTLALTNENFVELKDLLQRSTDVIHSFGLNHIFIKDIHDIVTVLDSRVCPNNWTICAAKAELEDIIFRLNTLCGYIHDKCVPNMNSKVEHFCMDVLDESH